MNDFGFIRIASCSLASKLLNCEDNAKQILAMIKKASENKANLILFQELSLTGASCGDLFFTKELLENAKSELLNIAESTKDLNIIVSIGFPFHVNKRLYNCSAVFYKGKIIAIVPLKTSLKSFSAIIPREENVAYLFGADYDISFGSFTFKILINKNSGLQDFTLLFENMLTENKHCGKDADILLLPTALASYADADLCSKARSISEAENSAVIFANAGLTESSGENIFLAECGIYECGKVLAEKNAFSLRDDIKDTGRSLEPRIDFSVSPFTISDIDLNIIQNKKLKKEDKDFQVNFNNQQISIAIEKIKDTTVLYPLEKCPYIPSIQDKSYNLSDFFTSILDYTAVGLARRLKAVSSEKLILGVSGGVDSTFALLVCVRTMLLLGKTCKNIFAFTLPCFGTSERSKSNAIGLAKNLGCSFESIDISKSVKAHFSDIKHNLEHKNTTFENAQARERTQVLMDKANQLGGIFVSASDLSELALGWSTFAGDGISMYNLASSLPKTVLQKALGFYAKQPELFNSVDPQNFSNIISDILNTPISPELLPPNPDNTISQKTEHILGPYELHDFFLYHFVKNNFTKEKIIFLAELTFAEKYSKEEIEKTAKTFFRRFLQSQFKRSCSPEGLSVLGLCLSPRAAWSMPSDLILE